ncbi:MAG: hypothetical protein CMN30_31915 [Sandaracinus sp.]|nr:hypothetical protein [Sandaracinus sp.]
MDFFGIHNIHSNRSELILSDHLTSVSVLHNHLTLVFTTRDDSATDEASRSCLGRKNESATKGDSFQKIFHFSFLI